MPPLLICLQGIQVLIFWIHDWLPLGSLNDVAVVRAHDTRNRPPV